MATFIRLVGLLVFGLPLSAFAQAGSSASVRRIVVFDSRVARAEQAGIAESSGGKLVRELPLINAVVVELPQAAALTLEATLKDRAGVVRVDEDPKINWLFAAPKGFAEVPFGDVSVDIPPFRKSNPAQRPAAQGGKAPWGVERVNAPAAWARTRGEGVKVCVVDTGIDRTHPDLKDNIAGGWNAITKSDDFTDDNGHGSHVSGTIAGLGLANGVVGVAPKASLYGVKVLDSEGSGTFDDVIAGMQWCVQEGMQVMSMSLGASQGNDSLKAAVEAVAKSQTVLIAAAGNDGDDGHGGDTVGYPARYPGAIAIAASNSADKVAYFSSRGPEVAFIAPGANVYSTYMNGGYETLSGTSMATPHVSGLAALLISAKHVSGVSAVREALAKAAAPLAGAPATQQGAGMIDAARLVR